MAPRSRKSVGGSRKQKNSSSRSRSRSSSSKGSMVTDVASKSGSVSGSRSSISDLDSRNSRIDSLAESLSASSIGQSSRNRSRQSSRKSSCSSRYPSRKSSRSARSCKCRCRASSKSVPRKSKKTRPAGNFARVRDEETRGQIREFLHLYSQDTNFDAFTIKVDGIPFVAVSLINADSPLLNKYFGGPPPPTPMKPSSNYLSGPRKRQNVSDMSSFDTSVSSKNKSVRFNDEGSRESMSSENSVSAKVSELIDTSKKRYSDLWKERALNKK